MRPHDSPLGVWLGALAAVALSLVFWHLASAGGPTPGLSPGVGAVLEKLASTPALVQHAAASVKTFAWGFAAAAVTGVILGLAIGSAEGARRLLRPMISALAALPMIVVAPLVVLYAGVGFGTIATVVFLTAVFPIADAVIGVFDQQVSPSNAGGATPNPSVGLAIFSGLRAGVVFAVTGLVVGEFIIGKEGLAFAAMNAIAMFDMATAVAAALLLFVISSVLFALLRSVEVMLERNAG